MILTTQDYSSFFSTNINQIFDLVTTGFSLPNYEIPSYYKGIQSTEKNISPKVILNSLLESYTSIIQAGVDEFRISGGLDSRVILYLAHETKLLPNKFVCLYHPKLGIESDRDAIIARNCFQEIGWSKKLEIRKNNMNSYFGDINSGIKLAGGLFGSELMGGSIIDNLPLNIITSDDSYSKCLNYKMLQKQKKKIDMFFKSNNYGPLLYCLTRSPRSVFYNSVRKSWSEPHLLYKKIPSPFAHVYFLKTISEMPTKEFRQYKMYKKIFDLISFFLPDIPLTNNHYNYFNEASTERNWGLDPKNLNLYQQPTASKRHRDLIIKYLIKYKIFTKEPKINDSLFLINCIDHIYYWILREL